MIVNKLGLLRTCYYSGGLWMEALKPEKNQEFKSTKTEKL